MRDATRELLIAAVGQRQPVSEGAIAGALGSMAPVPEVLRTQLMQLEREGAIRRDNNRQFSLVKEGEVAKSEEAKRTCSLCKQTKPADQMLQNGYCKPCGAKYARERYAANKRKGAKPARRAHATNGHAPPARAAGAGCSMEAIFQLAITDRAGEVHRIELGEAEAEQLRQCLDRHIHQPKAEAARRRP